MDAEYNRQELAEGLEKLPEQISPSFADKRGRKFARKYITGLLGSAERKNGRQPAEAIGDAAPYSIQQFVYRGSWSADRVRDQLREYVKENLGSEDAVLIVDETGFLKKGKKSAGVMRQYSGTAGRVENCRIGVFPAYAAPEGFALIDRELYLPKERIDDPQRCKEAGIPEGTAFRAKTQQALDMLKAAHEAGMPFSWVAADSVYGDARDISMRLESIKKGYVLAVSGKAYVRQGLRQHRISSIIKELAKDGWERISAGTGSKGEGYYDWLCTDLNSSPGTGWERRLLIRRSISSPDEVRAFICFCPESTPVETLASVAGVRWTIEQSFEESKGEAGLDHYEVRLFNAWYSRITLACCAHALLAVLRSRLQADASFQDAARTGDGSSLAAFKKGRGL